MERHPYQGNSSIGHSVTKEYRLGITSHWMIPLLKPESFIKLSSDARDPAFPHGTAVVPILSYSA